MHSRRKEILAELIYCQDYTPSSMTFTALQGGIPPDWIIAQIDKDETFE